MPTPNYDVTFGTLSVIPLSLTVRESVSFTVTVYEDDAQTIPKNLSGLAVFSEVRRRFGDETVLVYLVPVILGGVDGVITFNLPYVPEDVEPQNAFWDILLVNEPEQEQHYIVKGDVSIFGSITDGEGTPPLFPEIPESLFIGPQGEQGIQGIQGPPGADGADGEQGPPGQSITIAGTVATSLFLPEIVDPVVGSGYITSNTGHLWIFNGPLPNEELTQWEDVGNVTGPPGADGTDGIDGEGVPVGGTTGQVLAKNSNTDFDTEWINVEGVVDPTEGMTLQERIDYAYDHGKVMVPFGENIITEKVLTRNKAALIIDGYGAGMDAKPTQSPPMGARSSIHWGTSDPTITMLHVRGAGVRVQNVGFYGDEAGPTSIFNVHGGFPDSGILISSNQGIDAGTGSGQHFIEGCAFMYVRSAIESGETVAENDGNTVHINSLRVQQCHNAFRCNQLFGLGYSFYHGLYQNWTHDREFCKAFRILGGGDLLVDHWVFTSPCTLLSIEQTRSPVAIGSNASIWRMNNAKIDTHGGTSLKHLDIAEDNSVNNLIMNIEFNSICHSGTNVVYSNDDARVAIIRGRANVVYNDGMIRANLTEAYEWHNLGSGYPVLRYNGTMIHGITDVLSLLSPATSEGDLKFEAYCYDATGNKLPPFEGIISGTA